MLSVPTMFFELRFFSRTCIVIVGFYLFGFWGEQDRTMLLSLASKS